MANFTIVKHIPEVVFAGNPVTFGIIPGNRQEGGIPRPFYTLFLELWATVYGQNQQKVATLSGQPHPDTGIVYFNLSDDLQSITKPSQPWPMNADAVQDMQAVVSFHFTIHDGYGVPFTTYAPFYTSSNLLAIPGGFDNHTLEELERKNYSALQYLQVLKPFFTSIPPLAPVFPEQPIMLRYFNISSSSVAYSLRLKEYLTDGTDATRTLHSGTMQGRTMHTLNLTPSHIEVNPLATHWEAWLESDAQPISEKVSFSPSEEYPVNQRVFIFQNSLGGFDTVVSKGQRTIQAQGDSHMGYIAQSTPVRQWLEPTQQRRSTVKAYRGELGYFTDMELEWLQEFFSSERRWIVHNDKPTPFMLRGDSQLIATDEPPATIPIDGLIGSPDTFFFKRIARVEYNPTPDYPKDAFVTTWETSTNNELVTFPTAPYYGGVFDYSIDWNDGSEIEYFTNDTPPAHIYTKAGKYQPRVTGSLPRFAFIKEIVTWDEIGDPSQFKGVDNFGDVGFRSMHLMFARTGNIYMPNILTGHEMVTAMNHMFFNSQFNGNISEWDVSRIINMSFMFYNAGSFNQNIGDWNVSNVRDMSHMFNNAYYFNQDIGEWNVGNVTDMPGMFQYCGFFNQDIGNWNVSNVRSMAYMFYNTSRFNQDLSRWCVRGIPSKQTYFDYGANAWTLPRPVWGTCPNL